jgi:hypothetical protein
MRVVRCQAVRDREATAGTEVEVGCANEDEGAARGEEEARRARSVDGAGTIGSGGGSGGSEEGTVVSGL